MKKLFVVAFLTTLCFPYALRAQLTQKEIADREIMAAKQVLMRVVGMRSSAFEFEKIAPEQGGLDVYEVIALGGKVQVKGSSSIAMTRGAYDYMRKACNVQYTWSSQQVMLPKDLPDMNIPRTVSPYRFRQYYNVCNFGYSTAFWNFSDWEKEIDWMAMHGINMPLALTGQEAVWQKVYKDMGLSPEEISDFFSGPAFLPWQRMGNAFKHDGPLPQSYIGKSLELQKQILTRMKQLGMQPIVPGFSGIVPKAYSRINPNAQLREMKGWCDFPDENKSYILAPGSADFTSIGKSFIAEYRRTYGDVHLYLADLFNENEPTVSATNRDADLAAYGKSVYDAINAADPQGVWVMQGWLFFNQQNFWDKNAVKSFLSQVPDNRMMIIDLANESFAGWDKLDAFSGKPWIYSVIHNYGGNSQLGGNLPFFATNPAEMLASPKKGNLTGFGISPEGIENNEVVYELLTQMAWTNKAINIKDYFSDFSRERYGKTDPSIVEAWINLFSSVYTSNNEHSLNLYQARPPRSGNVNMRDDRAFDDAAACFIRAIPQYGNSPLFRNDLAQVITQYAGNKTDALLKRALELNDQGMKEESKRAFDRAFELMSMMDGLTYTMPDQRLERMIENARKWGDTKEESDYLEADAKRQVTQWGPGTTPVLHEYAAKVWSGLIRGYYLGRWQAYASSLQTGNSLDLNEWENRWITTPGNLTKAPNTGDVNKYAVTLYNATREYLNENLPLVIVSGAYQGNNQVLVSLYPMADSLKISYTVNGKDPVANGTLYDKPFTTALPAQVKAVGFRGSKVAGDVAVQMLPVTFGKSASLNPIPSGKYQARFGATLTDGKEGSENSNDGNWVGYEGENMGTLITLEGTFKISELTLSYLECGYSRIFAPRSVIVETSTDGINFKMAAVHDFDDNVWPMPSKKNKLTLSFPSTDAAFIRLLVFNRGTCPAGHPAAGSKAWMFIDEISAR
jgi:alpha-N-acetylglucosaminidase